MLAATVFPGLLGHNFPSIVSSVSGVPYFSVTILPCISPSLPVNVTDDEPTDFDFHVLRLHDQDLYLSSLLQ